MDLDAVEAMYRTIKPHELKYRYLTASAMHSHAYHAVRKQVNGWVVFVLILHVGRFCVYSVRPPQSIKNHD
jgi:hypothetical protein